MLMERKQEDWFDCPIFFDVLADMDKDGNGVDRCEFLAAFLAAMGKAPEKMWIRSWRASRNWTQIRAGSLTART